MSQIFRLQGFFLQQRGENPEDVNKLIKTLLLTLGKAAPKRIFRHSLPPCKSIPLASQPPKAPGVEIPAGSSLAPPKLEGSYQQQLQHLHAFHMQQLKVLQQQQLAQMNEFQQKLQELQQAHVQQLTLLQQQQISALEQIQLNNP